MQRLGAATSPTRILSALVWALAIGVGLYHAAIEVLTLAPYEPLGIYDTAYASIARVWPHNYEIGHFMDGLDPYGPGYPAFVRPFLAAGLSVFTAHHVANLVALLAACAILVRVLVRRAVPLVVVAAAVAIFYSLNAGSYSIQARPDFLAVLAMLATFAIGESLASGPGKPIGRCVGFGLASLAAYLTKPYGIFAWGVAVSYMVLFSREGVWRCILISAGIVALGIVAVASRMPLYLVEGFQMNTVARVSDWHWLFQQGRDFALLTAGVILTAIAGAWVAPAPKRKVDYWTWAVVCGVAALSVGMGWQLGAYLTYFLHLLLPQLVVLAALRTGGSSPRRMGALALLAANLAILAVYAPNLPRRDDGWELLVADMRHQSGPILADWFAQPMASERSDVTVIGNGISPVALLLADQLPAATDRDRSVKAAAAAYRQGLHDDFHGARRPTALYLEGVTWSYPTAEFEAGKNAEGRSTVIPYARSGDQTLVFIPRSLPGAYGEDLRARYAPVESFTIRPYYFATNEHREHAGERTTTVMKFVAIPGS